MSRLLRRSLVVLVLGVTGCTQGGGPLPQSPLSGAAVTQRAADSTYRLMHVFGIDPDGGFAPQAGLIRFDSLFYGTTAGGGKHAAGVVFRMGITGSEKVLHDFGGAGDDGRVPNGSLTELDGTLYGTTATGGSSKTCEDSYYNQIPCGTLFAITTDGDERVVHSFTGEDGSDPVGRLVALDGALYGTTKSGGAYAGKYIDDVGGTVFRMSKDGTERVLHNFAKDNDGDRPVDLIAYEGRLYGVTDRSGDGVGTVFSIAPNGDDYRVLHDFHGSDGIGPSALFAFDNRIYGTASFGGRTGLGLVFSMKPDGGDFKILHEFGSGDDGVEPTGLVEINGVLYGTTAYGGKFPSGYTSPPQIRGAGTLYSLKSDGSGYKIEHDFGQKTDGSHPIGLLLPSYGTLYGVTWRLGNVSVYGDSHSTAYAFKP